MHVKTGDKVQVMTGKDRGKTGKILKIDRKGSRVIVEGLNLVKRHTKPGANSTEGGIIEKEAFLSASNVLIFSEELERGVRTASRFMGQDEKTYDSKQLAVATFPSGEAKVAKVRVCVKTGEVFR
jgi:large subunit ribosomal protein L24